MAATATELASTGFSAGWLFVIGLLLLAVGAVLLNVKPRRRGGHR